VSKVNLNEINVVELEDLENEEKISKVKRTKMKAEDARWRNKKQDKGRHKARRNRQTAAAEAESAEE